MGRIQLNLLGRFCCSIVLGLSLAVMVRAACAQDTPLEAAVKATYIYKFVPFVQWPPSVPAASSDPIVFCEVGSPRLGDLLERALTGLRLSDRQTVLRRLESPNRDAGCHVLFAAPQAGTSVATTLQPLRGQPVLTVADEIDDPGHAAVIDFIVDQDRVRFDVNAAAAEANGLSVSSKLLSLALHVRSSP